MIQHVPLCLSVVLVIQRATLGLIHSLSCQIYTLYIHTLRSSTNTKSHQKFVHFFFVFQCILFIYLFTRRFFPHTKSHWIFFFILFWYLFFHIKMSIFFFIISKIFFFLPLFISKVLIEQFFLSSLIKNLTLFFD